MLTHSEIETNTLQQLAENPVELLGSLGLLLEHYSVSISDESGVIRFANDNFYNMTGLTAEETIGKSYEAADPRVQYWNDLRQKLSNNRVWRGEIRSRHSNGDFFWTDALIIPMSLLGGDGGCLSISTDITKLKYLLENLMADIDEKQSRLNKVQSVLMASRRILSLGTMASNIAHEINNPLSFVNANLQILEKKMHAITEMQSMPSIIKQSQLDFIIKEMPDLFREIGTGLTRVLQITNDLKAYCLNEDGALAKFNVNETVNRAVQLSAGLLRESIAIELHLNDALCVYGNESRIRQVFIDIITNAIQSLTDKEGVIQISTALSPEGDVVVVTIKDSGCGITPENIGRIFDPFFTTRPAGEGVGLGLTVCADVIEAHGGTIHCASAVGVGSEFIIKFPIAPPSFTND